MENIISAIPHCKRTALAKFWWEVIGKFSQIIVSMDDGGSSKFPHTVRGVGRGASKWGVFNLVAWTPSACHDGDLLKGFPITNPLGMTVSMPLCFSFQLRLGILNRLQYSLEFPDLCLLTSFCVSCSAVSGIFLLLLLLLIVSDASEARRLRVRFDRWDCFGWFEILLVVPCLSF